MPLFLLASMISGFGGGAIFPLFAAMTADYFGENNNATNYGLVYSSKVVSGLVGAGAGSVAAPRSRSPVQSVSAARSSRSSCASPRCRGRTSGYRRRKKEAASLALD
jgi:MFS family permease